MIQFQTLGGVELRGHGGEALHSVVARPKRVALLAYLALARPRGFHRRDTLLGLLWPELDAARARAALNKALHETRGSLGADVLLSRGKEEVGLDWQRFWCDAAGFEDAAARGEHAEGLALYRGDLLPGFFVEGAADYDRWLEHERARLRGLAVASARALSEAEEAAGRTAAAVEWARRTTDLSPFDEAALRRLMLLLEATSGRADALNEYRGFERRLQEELGVEPSAETAALHEAMRGRHAPHRPGAALPGRGGQAGPDAPPAVQPGPAAAEGAALAHGEPPPPDARAALPTTGAAPRTPTAAPSGRRPRRRVAPPAFAGVALLVVGWVVWPSGPRESTAGEASGGEPLAVLPFVASDASDADAGREIAALLGERLRGATPSLRAVEPRAVARSAAPGEGNALGAARAREIAVRLDAGLVLTGQIFRRADRLTVRGTLLDTLADAPPRLRVEAEGAADALDAIADQLAWQLAVAEPAPGRDLRAWSIAHTTNSIAAMGDHREGEIAYAEGRYRDAVAAFRRAVEADTAFAMAYFRLSHAANWAGDAQLARWAGSRASEHAHRLSPLVRVRVLGWDAYLASEPLEAERLLRLSVLNSPDAEGWFALGDVLFHWGPTLGWPAREAGHAFEQALALEPRHVGALVHYARHAAMGAVATPLDSVLAAAAGLSLDRTQMLELRVLQAFTGGDEARMDSVYREMLDLDDPAAQSVVTAVSVFAAEHPATARVPGALAGGPARALQLRLRASLLGPQLAAAHGRLEEADARLRSDTLLGTDRALEYRAALASLPFVTLPPAALRALRDELEAAADGRTGPGYEQIVDPGVDPARKHYLTAMLSLRLGDTAAVERHARTLEQRGEPGDRVWTYGQQLAGLVRAHLLHARGRPQEALASLDTARVTFDGVLPSVLSYPLADERFLRAELLRELGRDGEALDWYDTFPDPGGYDLMYLAPAHLRRAELHARREDRGAALESRARALGLWRNADPALRPWLEAALARIPAVRP